MIASVFSLLSFPFNYLKGVYSAHELFVEIKLFDFVLKLGTILFTVLLLLFGCGLYSLVLVYGFMPFITNVSKAYFLNRKGIKGDYRGWDKLIIKEIVGVSAWLFMSVMAELFINNISPTILAAHSTTAQVAIFGIAMTLYSYIYSFSGVINGMFLPRVTELHVQGKTSEVHQLCYRVARILLFITGFVALGFIAVGKDFVIAWVGLDFIDAYYVAVLLMLPQLFISTINIEYSHLLAANKIKRYSYIITLAALINLPISIVLSKPYGAIGVGVSIFLSTFIVLFGLMIVVYRHYLQFSIKQYFGNIYSIITAMIVVICLFSCCVKIFSLEFSNPWTTFIIRGLIFGVLYILLMPFAMNKCERQMTFGYVKSKFLKKA